MVLQRSFCFLAKTDSTLASIFQARCLDRGDVPLAVFAKPLAFPSKRLHHPESFLIRLFKLMKRILDFGVCHMNGFEKQRAVAN